MQQGTPPAPPPSQNPPAQQPPPNTQPSVPPQMPPTGGNMPVQSSQIPPQGANPPLQTQSSPSPSPMMPPTGPMSLPNGTPAGASAILSGRPLVTQTIMAQATGGAYGYGPAPNAIPGGVFGQQDPYSASQKNTTGSDSGTAIAVGVVFGLLVLAVSAKSSVLARRARTRIHKHTLNDWGCMADPGFPSMAILAIPQEWRYRNTMGSLFW